MPGFCSASVRAVAAPPQFVAPKSKLCAESETCPLVPVPESATSLGIGAQSATLPAARLSAPVAAPAVAGLKVAVALTASPAASVKEPDGLTENPVPDAESVTGAETLPAFAMTTAPLCDVLTGTELNPSDDLLTVTIAPRAVWVSAIECGESPTAFVFTTSPPP